MTVQVEHAVVLPATPAEVWSFIADPGKRAGAISVVEGYELHDDDGSRATWHVALPIPVVSGTIDVETEERERREPEFVKFVGRSTGMQVVGEHELTPVEGGTRLENRFVVDGRIPGVESFFKRNLEAELRNLMAALGAELGIDEDDVEVVE